MRNPLPLVVAIACAASLVLALAVGYRALNPDVHPAAATSPAIDAEVDPARIDFTIRECDCGFLNKTSKGIFPFDGVAIEIRAPEPGKPRPTEFDEKARETMRLVRQGDWHGSREFPETPSPVIPANVN